MIVQFFRTGTGRSKAPIDYLLGKNKDREYAKLLKGDLEEVASLIDSSPYVKKYTAGCLSFFEDDLSINNKNKIMAAFEKTLFPGLSSDQYRVVWIEHRDKENLETEKKRLELNFLIPNVEITTGKRLQPFFAKVDLERVDTFKTIVNHAFNLFDPDDPINRRSVKVAKNLPKEKKDFIVAINAEVALAVAEGLVSDRESLKSWMNTIGLEITRITKNQISVKNPNNTESKPIPLKGEFYEQNFRYSDYSAKFKKRASAEYRQQSKERYRDCNERFKSLYESKAEYHRKRYEPRDRTNSRGYTEQYKQYQNEHTSEDKYNRKESDYGCERNGEEATESNAKFERNLSNINRIEPRKRRTREAEKKPLFSEYSSSFNNSYFAYIEHLSRLRQQEQVQRHQQYAEPSRISEINGGELEYQQLRQQVVCSDRRDETRLFKWVQDSERGQLDEFRSTTISDYRKATEDTRRSIEAYQRAISNDTRVERLYREFNRKERRSETLNSALSDYSKEIIRADYLRKFFGELGSRLERAVRNTVKRVAERVEYREKCYTFDETSITEFSNTRDRETIEANDRASNEQNQFSRAISTKISDFNSSLIFKALDKLEQRINLQVVQEQKRDQEYDSPSPF